jgi:hypothetical protein
MLLVGALGCGGGQKPIPTSGVLTLDGEPLADARVTFLPTSEGGRMAWGQTDSLGRFRLTTSNTGDGALPGQYKITVQVIGPVTEADAKIVTDHKKILAERDRLLKIPRKEIHANYKTADKSPLKQEIPAEGEVQIPLTKSGT